MTAPPVQAIYTGLKTSGHLITQDSFSGLARQLRKEFDSRFAAPHAAKAERFVWDYWHIEDQYTLLRTPAYELFSKKLYSAFHQELLEYGREVLGCYDITPPWLSCYVEGCSQQLHADIPHGPWAFVYSLTPWKTRKFSGGETFLLKPETLNYWAHFSSLKGAEKIHLVSQVEPLFNRLTVFDPRLPHGVNEVRGARDVRDGRLVIHGWFKDPEPYVKGPLSRSAAAAGLNEILDRTFKSSTLSENCHGTLSYKLSVSATGKVTKIQRMTSTLLSLDPGQNVVPAFLKELESQCRRQLFKSARGPSQITFPLLLRF